MSERRDHSLGRIDQVGRELQLLVLHVRQHVEATWDESRRDGYDERWQLISANPERWVDIASDHLQLGLMALRRALERPDKF